MSQFENPTSEMRHFDEACEASRLLGATQYKKARGDYTEDDAQFERLMNESISMHRRAMAAENERLLAEVEGLKANAAAMQTWVDEGESICLAAQSVSYFFNLGAWWADRPWRVRAAAAIGEQMP